MTNHHLKQHSWREISSRFNRIYNHPVFYLALLSLSYFALLVISYKLGYLRGSSIGARHLSLFVHSRVATRCADPVPHEIVRQTILDHVYNGTSPYKELISPELTKINSSIMANLARGLNLKTQIIFVEDFQGCPGYSDLFMQDVVSENVTEFILTVPISPSLGVAKLCEWGIMGDLIEVDIGQDSYSAWSDINRIYQLLRPGGVLFGQNNGVEQAVKLFARVNKYRFKDDGQYWMISSA